ncbi:MAG: Clp protease N-terminal domain-containing protein [Tepidisphaerales bacterium]
MNASDQNTHRLTLGYRSVLDERVGPTFLAVLGGLCCSLLCLAALALSLASLGWAVALLLGCREPLVVPKGSGTAPRATAIGPALVAAMCFWGTVILFRGARRLFTVPQIGQRSNRFTYRSRLALVLANRRAVDRGARSLDAEHLLLGLLDSAPNTAVTVLSGLKIDMPGLRSRLAVGPRGQPDATADDVQILSPTPSCVRIVTRAVQLGCSENPGPVGTEHLLLALLGERAGIAGEVLRDARVDEAAVNAEIERLQAAAPAGMLPEIVEQEADADRPP